MNGDAKDIKDIKDLLLETPSSGGGSACSFSLGEAVPEAFGTDDTAIPASGPSSADVFNINMWCSDDDGVMPHRPSSLAGAAAACCGGLASRKPVAGAGAVVSGFGAAAGLVAPKPPSPAKEMLGEEGGGLVTRKPPPRAVNASRKLPPGAAREEDSESHSSEFFRDDATEGHSVHSSDGNEFGDDGSIGSVVGSVNGEGGAEMSDSSYAPSVLDMDDSSDSAYSSLSTSASPSADDMSCASNAGGISVVSFRGEEAPTLDRPIGIMLAKRDPGDAETDFVCSKIRQRYESIIDDKACEVFEVVLKDGKREEYSREEVLLYRKNYRENEGNMGCVEFFFKV